MMEATYTWITLGLPRSKKNMGHCCQVPTNYMNPSVIDIMGALIQSPKDFEAYIDKHITWNSHFSLGGELKTKKEGRPPSNFRYEEHAVLNENVVRNYMYIFRKASISNIQRPIFINTIPRSKRLVSFHITEDGIIQANVKENQGFQSDTFTESIQRFLGSFQIGKSEMKKLRQSCKQSKYNTYLIDMISFLYQLKNKGGDVWDYFQRDKRVPMITKNGNMSQLHMEHSSTTNGYTFYIPKLSSIQRIYQDFLHALDIHDNPIKQSIRKYVCENYIHRWTDFDANDIDDALTLLMIVNAFQCNNKRSTKLEAKVYRSLEEQLEPWIQRLNYF